MNNLTNAEKMAITKYDLYYERRMTAVESAVETLVKDVSEIKSDFRWLLGIIIGSNAGLFALMAHGFKWF